MPTDMERRFLMTQFRAAFGAIVDKHLPGNCASCASNGRCSTKSQSGIWALRWKVLARAVWPVKHGGMGLDASKHMIYVEEWGAPSGCPRLPDHGVSLVGPLLMEFGTQAQIAHFLPKVFTAEHIWCQGDPEPNSGSDLASLRTAAVRDGDHFVVNGQKIWTTLAHCANWMFALVRTGRDEKVRQKGITVLLIDLTSPGVTVRPHRQSRAARPTSAKSSSTMCAHPSEMSWAKWIRVGT